MILRRTYNPCDLQYHEGVTYVTLPPHSYAIKGGALTMTITHPFRSVHTIPIKAIGAFRENKRKYLDDLFSDFLLRGNTQVERLISPYLLEPREGLCLFILYTPPVKKVPLYDLTDKIEHILRSKPLA